MKEHKPRICKKCGVQFFTDRCRPCTNISERKIRKENPEKSKGYSAKWRMANPEAMAEARRRWNEKNPEKLKIYSSSNAWKYIEKRRESVKKWKANNKEKARKSSITYSHNRRAREKGSAGKLSKNLALKLLSLQKGKCACCGKPLGKDFHMDHIMPLALGGSNTDDNIQLLAKICNIRKNAKHPVDYMRSKGFLL